MNFNCSICGAEHNLDEISFGADAPMQWDLLTTAERSRSMLSGEQCEIDSKDGRSFFIRAVLEIPIRNTNSSFTWGVWCSLSEKNYIEISEHWCDTNREQLGPYFGWLCTKLPYYPDSMFLKTMVHQRAVGLRPRVELEPSAHPLSVEQRDGIEENRLREIITKLLHNNVNPNAEVHTS